MHLNIESLANGTANLNEQLLEDTLYEVALAELENNVPEKITMARALANADGDTELAMLKYPELRIIRLKAELSQFRKDTRSKTIEQSVTKISHMMNDFFDTITPSADRADKVKKKRTSFDEAFSWDED